MFVVASATSYIDNESTHGLQTIKLRATYQEMIISLKGKERFDLTLTDGSDSLDRMTATIKDLTGLPNPLQGLYNQRKEAMEEKRKLWKECCEGIAALREKKTRAEKTLVEVERSKSYWSTLDNVIVECYGMERDVPSNHGIEERASKLRSTTTELQKDLEGLQTTALQRQKELQLEIQAKRHTAKELWTNIDRYVTGEQDFYEKIKTKFGAHIRDWCNGLSAWCEQDSE